MKIQLYLMGQKGFACLEALLQLTKANHDFQISAVIGSKDPAVIDDYFSAIESLCQTCKLTFYERGSKINVADVDVIFAISWRWLIHENLDKLIVFHDSILPKLRGFNPLVTALIEGHDKIGVTAIVANKEFDKGNIVGSKKTSINYPITIKQAIEEVSGLYVELIIALLQERIKGKWNETEQVEFEATYSLWRDEQDYNLDWNLPAKRLARTIDATGFPYQGASSMIDNKKIRILNASAVDDVNIVNRSAGKILYITNNQPVVVCGTGLLKIEHAIYDTTLQKVTFGKLRLRFI